MYRRREEPWEIRGSERQKNQNSCEGKRERKKRDRDSGGKPRATESTGKLVEEGSYY